MSGDTGRHNDTGRCRPVSSDNFYMQIVVPCGCRTMSYDIVYDILRLTQKLNSWFNFCVSVVAMSYDIVRYVNSAVKSMCSITATPDNIVRCRAECEHSLSAEYLLLVWRLVARGFFRGRQPNGRDIHDIIIALCIAANAR